MPLVSFKQSPRFRVARSGVHVCGFSLTELLISLAVGFIVTGGVIAIFAANVQSNSDTLRTTLLDQQLRAAMDVMVRDIRRAGYSVTAAAVGGAAVAVNPFTVGANNVTVFNTVNPGSCILYTYDIGNPAAPLQNGVVNTGAGGFPNERFGFRRTVNGAGRGVVSMRTGGANFNCNGGPFAWPLLTDPAVVHITNLSFVLDTTTVPTGSITPPRFLRSVTISLTGELVQDPATNRMIIETVRVQNDA